MKQIKANNVCDCTGCYYFENKIECDEVKCDSDMIFIDDSKR